MMPQYFKVTRSKLVLIKGQIPRQQFILMLALHRRLSTVDRVQKWGIALSTGCVISNNQVEETFEHLLINCPYSTSIWFSLPKWLSYLRPIGDKNREVSWLTQRINNSRPQAGMLGFCFGAAVYQRWGEKQHEIQQTGHRDKGSEILLSRWTRDKGNANGYRSRSRLTHIRYSTQYSC